MFAIGKNARPKDSPAQRKNGRKRAEPARLN
jgi:hypothetical protein